MLDLTIHLFFLGGPRLFSIPAFLLGIFLKLAEKLSTYFSLNYWIVKISLLLKCIFDSIVGLHRPWKGHHWGSESKESISYFFFGLALLALLAYYVVSKDFATLYKCRIQQQSFFFDLEHIKKRPLLSCVFLDHQRNFKWLMDWCTVVCILVRIQPF